MIIFSAGIGENSYEIRESICKEIEPALGLKIDYEKNKGKRGVEVVISKPESPIVVAVIPTDEEVMIARDTYHFYKK